MVPLIRFFAAPAALLCVAIGQAQTSAVEGFRHAARGLSSLRIELSVKEGRNTPQLVRLWFAKPSHLRIEAQGNVFATNGKIVETTRPGETPISLPFTSDRLGKAFDTPALGIWRVLMDSQTLDKMEVANLGRELVDGLLVDSVRLSDAAKGMTITLQIDAQTQLPVSYQVYSREQQEPISVKVVAAETNQAIAMSLFLVDTTPEARQAAKTDSISLPWAEFRRGSISIWPVSTPLELTGSPPNEIYNQSLPQHERERALRTIGVQPKYTLFVDGSRHSETASFSDWSLRWIPSGKQGTRHNLRLVVSVGSKSVELGSIDIQIRDDLPWTLAKGEVLRDGTATITGTFPMIDQVQTLTLTSDGESIPSEAANTYIALKANSLVPGPRTVTGSVVMKFGAKFQLQPASVVIEPWIQVNPHTPTNVTVTKDNIDGATIYQLTSKPGTSTGSLSVVVNGVKTSLRARGNQAIVPYDLLADGQNQVYFVLATAEGTYCTPPFSLTAAVASDAQAIIASGQAIDRLRVPLYLATYWTAKALGLIEHWERIPEGFPSELEVVLQSRKKEWKDLSRQTAELAKKGWVPPGITKDAGFNEGLKGLSATVATVLQSFAALGAHLSQAHCVDGDFSRLLQVKKAADALDEIRKSLDRAITFSDVISQGLVEVESFFVRFPSRRPETFRGLSTLFATEIHARESHKHHIRFVTIARDIALVRNDKGELEKLREFVQRQDGPLFDNLTHACNDLLSLFAIRAQLGALRANAERLTEQIEDAVKAKDFARADRLRNELRIVESKIAELVTLAIATRDGAWLKVVKVGKGLDMDLTGLAERVSTEDPPF